ncbi:MAG: hypothetical protein R2739_06700 [Chitinophagales bacterium]
MKKITLTFSLFFMLIYLPFIANADKGNKNKQATTAPVVDKLAQKNAEDSIVYANFMVNSNNHTFQNTPNEILLSNGMKIKFIKLNRFPIPRGVTVQIPDAISQRFNYELAEVEMQATNTNSTEVKLGQTASEALFVSFKMFSAETGSKTFTSQYPLSYGAIYAKTEPAQTEKVTPIYKQTTAFVNNSYKPGETKTSIGYIICLSKQAKTIDKIILQTQEFGTNKTYACPAKL